MRPRGALPFPEVTLNPSLSDTCPPRKMCERAVAGEPHALNPVRCRVWDGGLPFWLLFLRLTQLLLACRRISNLAKQDASHPAHRSRSRAVSEGGAAPAGQPPAESAGHDGYPDHVAEVTGLPVGRRVGGGVLPRSGVYVLDSQASSVLPGPSPSLWHITSHFPCPEEAAAAPHLGFYGDVACGSHSSAQTCCVWHVLGLKIY